MNSPKNMALLIVIANTTAIGQNKRIFLCYNNHF